MSDLGYDTERLDRFFDDLVYRILKMVASSGACNTGKTGTIEGVIFNELLHIGLVSLKNLDFVISEAGKEYIRQHELEVDK